MSTKQSFARKVVVVAYYLEEHKSGKLIPHFLMTVIVPKQPAKATADWQNTKRFKVPRGYSLIKGTREMIRDAQVQDIPPGFNRYFKKLVSGKITTKNVDQSIEGIIPAAQTAVKEAKEEAGIKQSNVQLIIDFGQCKIKMDGSTQKVNSFAMELKKPSYAKAIDSLAMDYFTLGELRLGAKQRTRYNIPLVRPSHVDFVENMVKILKQHYQLVGKTLSDETVTRKKDQKKEKKKINESKIYFRQLAKDARNGRFIAFQHSAKKTNKNIIKKSEHSRDKKKQVPIEN